MILNKDRKHCTMYIHKELSYLHKLAHIEDSTMRALNINDRYTIFEPPCLTCGQSEKNCKESCAKLWAQQHKYLHR